MSLNGNGVLTPAQVLEVLLAIEKNDSGEVNRQDLVHGGLMHAADVLTQVNMIRVSNTSHGDRIYLRLAPAGREYMDAVKTYTEQFLNVYLEAARAREPLKLPDSETNPSA